MGSSRPGPGEPGLGIGEGLRRHAGHLLDLQMWCFGRDIHHPDGNALIRYGFTICRPPAKAVGSSAYSLAIGPGHRLTVWGFGFCAGGDPADGMIHLARGRFAPTWRAEPELPGPAWDPTALPRFRTPCGAPEWAAARRLLGVALRALGDYEAWALASLGPDHRPAAVRAWPKARIAPERIAPSWRSLARRVGPGAF